MKTVEISIENARTAYNEAGAEIKQTLLKLIGPKVLFDKITDVVKSYEDACQIEGSKPLTIENFAFLPKKDRQHHFAAHQLIVINRVLNEGWEPDYSNGSEYKYYPYFIWNKDAAGGPGFSYIVYDCGNSDSFVGARLVFKSSDLAKYAGNQFLSIYNQYLQL